MANSEYAILFNEELLAINPSAPLVDPARFARTCELLECDELIALFIMGTQVPPDMALVVNRKLPLSILREAFSERAIKKNLVTARELADYYMRPIEEVAGHLHAMPRDSSAYYSWLSEQFERWDRTRISMVVRGVEDVIRDKGMPIDRAHAVKFCSDKQKGESVWFAIGQRVCAEWDMLDEPVEGTIEVIDPIFATAQLALADGRTTLPGLFTRLVRFDWLVALEDATPHDLEEQGNQLSEALEPWPFINRMTTKAIEQRQAEIEKAAYNAIVEQFYTPYSFLPSLGHLQLIRSYTSCDSETAFYVLGTHAEDRNVLIVNRRVPKSVQEDAYLLEELPRDVVTVEDVANCYWQPIDLVRKQLSTCDYDLSSDAAQTLIETWKVSKQKMIAHGIVVETMSSFDIYRLAGMGANEAHAVSIACITDAGIDDGNGADTAHDANANGDVKTKLLIVGERVRVDVGAYAGLEGKLTSIAPEDGLGGVALEQEERTLSTTIPLCDLTMLVQTKS